MTFGPFKDDPLKASFITVAGRILIKNEQGDWYDNLGHLHIVTLQDDGSIRIVGPNLDMKLL